MEDGMQDELGLTVERLAAAVSALEVAVERMGAMEASASIGPIVATVENAREVELERKLAVAEAEIAGLKASATSTVTHSGGGLGRKTLPAGMVSLLAKQGVTVDSVEAGALDAALVSLSIEQRMAVKGQLMRAGLV